MANLHGIINGDGQTASSKQAELVQYCASKNGGNQLTKLPLAPLEPELTFV